jgi:peptidoglycan hydrolase-like protein with peptidoglycan-binding domain
MRELLATLAAMLLLALIGAGTAEAATVIFYSKADNAYGWCAGYSSSRGETCAKGQCEKYGNDCFLALECPGGYGAAAFAPAPVPGFGASCKYANASSARAVALIACILVSHTLCATSEAFSGGGSTTSAAANEEFDRAFYMQGMLNLAHYDAGDTDGQVGAKTRAAIKAFQVDLGLDPTGEVSSDLYNLAFFAARGTHRVVDVMVGDKAMQDQMAPFSYGFSREPAADQSFTVELLARGDTDQRLALATVMTLAGTRCTLPAQKVEIVDEAAEAWNVDCAEGQYFVVLAKDSTVVTQGHGNADTTQSPGYIVTDRSQEGRKDDPNKSSH